MSKTTDSSTVCFSVKGQVVIPRWLRTEFGIEEGTRARVVATPQGILLTPVTHSFIRSLRGTLKGSGVLKALEDDRQGEKDL